MWTHWVYKKDHLSDLLEQGDVLKVTPELQGLLTTYHPYYASHIDNRFYQVLTQSCDLVKRSSSCNARYVSLAPVRPLKSIIQREFDGKLKRVDDGAYGSEYVKNEIEKFLARIFNNNEPAHFYLEPEAKAGITEPMCSVLSLPISLKSEHYQKFLDAKVIGIEDSFQAKLGSLLGQLYSRVGTKDFESLLLTKKIQESVEGLAVWMSTPDEKAVSKLIEEQLAASPGDHIDLKAVATFQQKLPKTKELAINLILDIAAGLQLIPSPSPARYKFRKAMNNDAAFARYF